MIETTATPMPPRRRWREALLFVAGCLFTAAFLYGCYRLMELGVPAALAFLVPFGLASWIYARWERRAGSRG